MRGLARCAVLAAAPAALGFQVLDAEAGQQQQSLRARADGLGSASGVAGHEVALDETSVQQSSVVLDEISAQQSSVVLDEISAQQISSRSVQQVDAESPIAQLSDEVRERLRKMTGAKDDATLAAAMFPGSAEGRPVLVAPPYLRNQPASRPTAERAASLLSFGAGDRSAAKAAGAGAGLAEFAPSAEFQAEASGEAARAAGAAEAAAEAAGALPWGVGSPRTGDSLPNFHYSSMPMIDGPKEWEYSLESGDNIRSFSSAQQDVKLVTQVFENITNGFYVDSNAGDGEINSNTLLLELAGWRGLIMEPRPYWYMNLWSKWRKAWLFLGCLSPHENSTKIGFDTDGNIDMLSGHMIHAHPMKSFMAEMGGRKTIDFWNLNSGNYEAEILNETLLGSGSFLEFGVVLVRFDGRRAGRGTEPYVQMRSRDATEELIFEICHNASLRHIGGLDAYWINHVEPRYGFKDEVWVNPRYFERRGIPTPTSLKSAPPPPLADYSPHTSADFSWDYGYSRFEEIG
ncbi:unnamed protein product, partial [Prorocentrum cordatum]